jgi:copper transporter 1
MVAHGGHDEGMESMAGMDMGSSMGSSSSMSSHTGMAMAFFTSTSTPLYSESWTPQNAGQYAGTCIFLIFLAIALRAIFTAKAFLEMKALEGALKRRYVVVAGEKMVSERAANDGDSMTGILTTNGIQEDVRVVSAPVKHIQPWRFGVDLPRALLMTIATAVGYLLYVATQTAASHEQLLTTMQHVGGHDFQYWILSIGPCRRFHRRGRAWAVQQRVHGWHVEFIRCGAMEISWRYYKSNSNSFNTV